jgi:hypothetical protein
MKRVLLAVVAALAVAAVAGSAQAAPVTACSMVKASEYAKVLGKAVKMTPGEGSSSCNVSIGRTGLNGSTWIIPNLNPYNAAYIKRMYKLTKGLQRVPALGPMGAVVVGSDGSVTSYTQKGSWFVSFQGEKGVTKTQMLALASLVYHRL